MPAVTGTTIHAVINVANREIKVCSYGKRPFDHFGNSLHEDNDLYQECAAGLELR
jgi:hypothetical protein